MALDALKLSQDLIRCKSVTPEEAGALDVVEKALKTLKFDVERITFKGDGGKPTENLYATLGSGEPHLCFAGHVDVVPPGDIKAWSHDPFKATVTKEGVLIGRGASDMKCAVACWIAALSEFLKKNKSPKGTLSLLLTCDEEAEGINGTKKLIPWLKKKKQVINHCIVGEPTNPHNIGDMAKIGRRGSMDFHLTVHGKQGHVAYPDLAHNPVTDLVNILQRLKSASIDGGSKHFLPSNLEITTIDVGNPTGNVIPASAKATFNIRYNDWHSDIFLLSWVKQICEAFSDDFTLDHRTGAESFLSKPGYLSELVVSAVQKVAKKTPELSTTGGTSDARFIKDIAEVVEFGGINTTAHQVNENMEVKDIELLKNIYLDILTGYFKNPPK